MTITLVAKLNIGKAYFENVNITNETITLHNPEDWGRVSYHYSKARARKILSCLSAEDFINPAENGTVNCGSHCNMC